VGNDRVSFESYDNALRILSWFFPGRDFASAVPGQLHGDPGCTIAINGALCSCALAPVADRSSAAAAFAALTNVYLHHEEVERLLSSGPLSTALAPLASVELAASLSSAAVPAFLLPTVQGLYDRVAAAGDAADVVTFADVAVRGLVFDALCNEVPGKFSADAQPAARDLLRRWLLSADLFEAPLRCLEVAWETGPVRSSGYHGQLPRLGPLFASWVAALRVALLDDWSCDGLHVCRLFTLPRAGEGLLSLRSLSARSCVLVEAGGVLYGSCPGPVLSWLSRTQVHALFEGFSGPPLAQGLGRAPRGCFPEHWPEAAALYADGGFSSFADALATAALL